jgi:hypothetical protein
VSTRKKLQTHKASTNGPSERKALAKVSGSAGRPCLQKQKTINMIHGPGSLPKPEAMLVGIQSAMYNPQRQARPEATACACTACPRGELDHTTSQHLRVSPGWSLGVETGIQPKTTTSGAKTNMRWSTKAMAGTPRTMPIVALM